METNYQTSSTYLLTEGSILEKGLLIMYAKFNHKLIGIMDIEYEFLKKYIVG